MELSLPHFACADELAQVLDSLSNISCFSLGYLVDLGCDRLEDAVHFGQFHVKILFLVLDLILQILVCLSTFIANQRVQLLLSLLSLNRH